MKNAETALIVGGGPGVSASCARLLKAEGIQVAVAARDITKDALKELEEKGCHLYKCDASIPESVENLFKTVEENLKTPKLVIHNIDGRTSEIFRKAITEAAPALVQKVIQNSAFSAFLIGQQAAKCMMKTKIPENGHRGTIIFTNATAAFKGVPNSGAFALACHGKSGLAQSMARELMPKGIHVAHVPIDTAIGRKNKDGSISHRIAGRMKNDDMSDPDQIAKVYYQIHQQHRSTWTYEVILRPWLEDW